MSRRDDLIALRDAVQNDESIWPGQLDGTGLQMDPFGHAYNGSVDASLAFLAAVLPEWTVNGLTQLRHPDNGMKPTGQWDCLIFAAFESRFAHASAKSETPARALLLATLNALIAESDT